MFSKMHAKKQTEPEWYCDRCGRLIEPEEPMTLLTKPPRIADVSISKWIRMAENTLCCMDCVKCGVSNME